MKPGDRPLAVLLTAPLPAAIAVVRLSGALVQDFASAHLSKPLRLSRCIHCNLHDAGEIIDDIVVVLVAPDRLDLNLHGGPWITEAALRLTAQFGFDVVPWQQACEMATDATSEMEVEVAAALPYAVTREALTILLAQPAAWQAMLAANDAAAMQRAMADRTVKHIVKPPTVAIVGEPNAGKSTLLNRLAGQARSIVADVPGTTRDYVTTPANLGGLLVNLIDTPGLRQTTDPIEAAAIARATAIIASADIVIELRDATRPPPVPPRHERADAIVAVNKADRANVAATLPISAATGEGVTALCDRVRAALRVDDLRSPHARCWTRRHRDELTSRIDAAN